MKRTKNFDIKRDEIVRVASRLINTYGSLGFSSADVASETGLTQNSMKYYFPRKSDLIRACFDQTLDRLEGLVTQAEAAPDPVSRITAFFDLAFTRVAELNVDGKRHFLRLADLRTTAEPDRTELLKRYNILFDKISSFFSDSDSYNKKFSSIRAHILLESILGLWFLLPLFNVSDSDRIKKHIFSFLTIGLDQNKSGSAHHLESVNYDSDSNISNFLKSGIRLINERGFRGASVDLISSELGNTKGSFYHHLSSKTDLVLLCFDQSFSVIERVIDYFDKQNIDNLDKLLSICTTLFRFQISGKEPILRFSSVFAIRDEYRNDIMERRNKIRRRIYGILVDGMMDKSLPIIDPNIVGHLLLSTVDAAYEISVDVDNISIDSIANEYMQNIQLGILRNIEK